MVTWSSWCRWITCSYLCLKIIYMYLINVFKICACISKDLQHGELLFTCVNWLHSSVSLQWGVDLWRMIFRGCENYRNYQNEGLYDAGRETWSTLFHIPSPSLNGKNNLIHNVFVFGWQLFPTNRSPKIIRKSVFFRGCAPPCSLNSNQWLFTHSARYCWSFWSGERLLRSAWQTISWRSTPCNAGREIITAMAWWHVAVGINGSTHFYMGYIDCLVGLVG